MSRNQQVPLKHCLQRRSCWSLLNRNEKNTVVFIQHMTKSLFIHLPPFYDRFFFFFPWMAIWRTIHQLIGASLNYWSKPNFCQMRVDTLISNLPNERWDKEYHISSLDRSVCVFVCLTVTDSEALSSFLLKASHWTSSCIQYLTPHFSHVPY